MVFAEALLVASVVRVVVDGVGREAGRARLRGVAPAEAEERDLSVECAKTSASAWRADGGTTAAHRDLSG